MVEVEYLSIAEFAEKAGVSKQAIYKQVNNENSQIAPYLLREGKRPLIKVSALKELYKVDTDNLTFTTSIEGGETTPSTPKEHNRVEETTQDNPEGQPEARVSTPNFQPISTDYIDFLKAQIADLKADKEATEKRLNNTIAEKDSIIKEQSAQLAQLAQRVAQIADKAILTTAQQQYLTAKAGNDTVEVNPANEPAVMPIEEDIPITKPKKSLWSRLFSR